RCAGEDGKKPKPGDLIEVKCGVYKHWIVYIGEDNVGTIKKEKLKDVVKDGKWKINNFLDQKYQPRKDDDIVKEACARVGSSLTYDVLGYNCEHFATELRYGKPECRQASSAITEFSTQTAITARNAVHLVYLLIPSHEMSVLMQN
uniref:LRAT domain-containing protein n=1 Tax=Nothobranchius furzeri TaxID=105023 RepID=A0A8C6LCZ2_NOTFU